MITIILISILLLALAMAFMAVNILLRKNGKFPVYSIGHNKNMQEIGISCVKHDEIESHKQFREGGCRGCGARC